MNFYDDDKHDIIRKTLRHASPAIRIAPCLLLSETYPPHDLSYASPRAPELVVGTAGIRIAKAMAERVACAEELFDELLIHHRHGRRGQRVLDCKSPAHHNVCSHGIEVLGVALYP